MKQVKVTQTFMQKFTKFVSSTLCAVLFICANTNSCCMVHQPHAPAELERFSKIK